MKKFYAIIAMVIMALLITATALHAQNFHVLDINHTTDAYPANNFQFPEEQWENYTKYGYAVLNGIAYFTANDGIIGEALWRSDGTAAGTYMVKDIYTDYLLERMYNLTVSGNKVFFKVEGPYGQELWATDGTSAGTYVVLSAGPAMYYLTDLNGTLYFMRSNYGTADQLWRTDGTPEGTWMISDLYWEIGGYRSTKLTAVQGRLFFVFESWNYGQELFTNDGTSGSTHLVKDINPSGGSSPSQLTALNGLLCFAADDGTGKQVWVSDGTEAGTYKAGNPNNITVNDHGGTDFTIKNSSIYFSGDINDGNGTRLCTYNTSSQANKVKAIKTINPGFVSSNLYNVTNVKGTLFFTVFNGIDQVLWKSDGTAAGTMQVKGMNPGGRNVYWYKEFENAGGTLIFSFYDDIHGSELWKSDGTKAGTVMIKEITPGVYSAQPSNITYIGNGISLFLATDEKKGFELWKTDGTEAGTTRVKDIKLTSSYSSNPFMLTANNDKSRLLLGASDTKYGSELRITDGTEAGTCVVKDIFKGMLGSNPSNAVNFKGDTYFFADILDTTIHNTSDVRTVRKLCKTNGTSGGTKILSLPSLEALINGNGYLYAVEAASDLLYMILVNYSTGQYELWRTDGINAGTYAIKTDLPYYYSTGLRAVGNKLFYINYDFNYGFELFVTDGSTAGTGLLKDINPGFNSTNFAGLTSYNGKLYFTADFGYGPFFWSSDGTGEGTKQVKPAIIAYKYDSSPFAQANGRLFFYGLKNVGTGTELYSFDGTNITLVKDLFKGVGSSSIYDNIVGGDTLCYFFASDEKHGHELWKSNGTKEGTRLVKDITESGDTWGANLITVHNQLFFTVYDVLWQSDGTKNGTHMVDDTGLSGVTDMRNFTAFDNKLAFTAFAPSTGYELYIGDVESFTPLASTEDKMKSATATSSFNVYPNPARDVLNIYTGNKARLSLIDQSGKLLLTRSIEGKVAIDISRLRTGIYYLKNIETGEMKKVVVTK